jgi:antirestriction protein ArdC
MPRTITEDQKQKAAERREVFKQFCQRVAAMSEDQRAQLAQRMPIVNTEGHALSAYNTCLILSQSATTPTICAGFQQWRKQGRMVRKGEHGLMIWVPISRKSKAADTSTPGELVADGTARPGFIAGYVFDISQTDAIESEGGAI